LSPAGETPRSSNQPSPVTTPSTGALLSYEFSNIRVCGFEIASFDILTNTAKASS
jgi:hypothetical protein